MNFYDILQELAIMLLIRKSYWKVGQSVESNVIESGTLTMHDCWPNWNNDFPNLME